MKKIRFSNEEVLYSVDEVVKLISDSVKCGFDIYCHLPAEPSAGGEVIKDGMQ